MPFGHLFAATTSDQFINLEGQPDDVSIVSDSGSNSLQLTSTGVWSNDGVCVSFRSRGLGLRVVLSAPHTGMKWLQVHWKAKLDPGWKYLGDAWERAYGDLQWKPMDAKRVMPWYFLASNGELTHGYGVMTGPRALCYWTVDGSGITLHADVRCGGVGVQLGKRRLDVCTVVSRRGSADETSFAAAQVFCKLMCTSPRLPRNPVYGFNDWYCTYGHDTADNFLSNVAFIGTLSTNEANRPFAVVDDGWQWKGEDGTKPGLWNRTNPDFSQTLTMAALAAKIKVLGSRPGLWYRPLIANADAPNGWRLQRDSSILDPTVPEVRVLIRKTVSRFHSWGYELIKYDYSTFDVCGRWGMQMGPEVTPDGWAFADRTKTTAEVIRDLYRDIREAAGNDTMIIGCNTAGHLAAGINEVQRIGDDTSGSDWKRTCKMGVNSVAFRAPQNGTFFAVDADCAGQVSSNSVPWGKNSQWLNLLAHSGTTLFTSFPKNTLSPEQINSLRTALTASSFPQPTAEALDWQCRRTPRLWREDKKEVTFFW